jgi:hypothetical protein
MILSLIATLVKRLGAVCIVFVILWHVTDHTGPRRGKAVVHVSRPDVHVVIDYRDFPVASIAQSPVVCELEPGNHVASVRHGKVMLDEQSFSIDPGQEIVLHLEDHFPRSAASRPAPRSVDIKSAGLAVETSRRRPGRARTATVRRGSPGPEGHHPTPDRHSAHRSAGQVHAVAVPSLQGL